MRPAIFTPHLLPGNSSPADLTAHAAAEAQPAAAGASVWKRLLVWKRRCWSGGHSNKTEASWGCDSAAGSTDHVAQKENQRIFSSIVLHLLENNLIGSYFLIETLQISGVFLSDTLGRGIPRRSDKPGFVLLSQHITESGRGSGLAKEAGAARNNSDPVLTARHLVTDNEAASQETLFSLAFFSAPPSLSSLLAASRPNRFDAVAGRLWSMCMSEQLKS